MFKASYFEHRSNNNVKCLLCPHYCIISNNKIGKCQIRKNIDGQLYATTYKEISSLALDPIEKKPLYHFYPSKNILSIGSNGCNLKCPFCQNWQISMQETNRKKITFIDLIKLIKEHNSIGIAYTYNEPLISYEFLYDFTKEVKKNNLKNVIVSNGFINQEPLSNIIPFIDAANIDLKGFNNEFYNFVDGKLDTVKNTIKELFNNNVHIEITFLLIPNKNDDKNNFESMCNWLAKISEEIPLHISRYFPNYKLKELPTDETLLFDFYKIAKNYLNNVYIGNIYINDTQNTYCPKCGEMLIERTSKIKLNLKENKCPNCSYSPYLCL